MADDQFECTDLRALPNLRVELDADDVSDDGQQGVSYNLSNNFGEVLFAEGSASALPCNEEDWALPKLKTTEKGKPVSQALASLINTACTKGCDIEHYTAKYKVQENCEMACPPLVNQEVWKI